MTTQVDRALGRAIGLCVLASIGCTRKGSEPPASGGRPDAAQAQSADVPKSASSTLAVAHGSQHGRGTGHGGGGGGSGGGGGGGGIDSSAEPLPPEQRGQRFREATVYFDGVPIAALAFGELPPEVKPRWVEIEKGYKVRRFVLTEYLKGLGVDAAKLKAIHFYGGRTRLAILDGREVRRQGARILFSFTQGDTGKPRFHWPPGTRVNDTIDKINNVAIYQDKKPPVWDNERYVLVLDGEELEGEIPYATSELRGGTRVYLDGRLVANVKRNAIDALGLASTSTGAVPRWSLAGFLEASGAKLDGVKSYDVVNEDALAGRFEAKDLRQLELVFVDKGGGQTRIHPKGLLATSVLLYAKKRPPALADRR